MPTTTPAAQPRVSKTKAVSVPTAYNRHTQGRSRSLLLASWRMTLGPSVQIEAQPFKVARGEWPPKRRQPGHVNRDEHHAVADFSVVSLRPAELAANDATHLGTFGNVGG